MAVRPTRRASPDAAPQAPGPLRTAASLVRTAANVHLRRRHPLSLVHFVTRRCNARCSFCFIDFDNPSPKSQELTIDEVEVLTRTLGPHLINVNLTGGEPFLRGDLGAIADAYYRNAGVRSVYVTSNGGFPDRAVATATDLLHEHPDRTFVVSLSIDSFPEQHDLIRRVDGLFEKVMETYHGLRDLGPGVMANVGITVSHENHEHVLDIYEHLVSDRGVRSVTAIIVRDEGVYTVPREDRAAISASHRALTRRITADMHSGRLEGYDPTTLQGRLMNAKNELLWDLMDDIYVDPHYLSRCHSGTLFGVIDADGTVHPCEVLDRPLGNLRDHGMDFGRLWRSDAAREVSDWIGESRCHCTYECAWAFNILGNARYQPHLARAALPFPRRRDRG